MAAASKPSITGTMSIRIRSTGSASDPGNSPPPAFRFLPSYLRSRLCQQFFGNHGIDTGAILCHEEPDSAQINLLRGRCSRHVLVAVRVQGAHRKSRPLSGMLCTEMAPFKSCTNSRNNRHAQPGSLCSVRP